MKIDNTQQKCKCGLCGDRDEMFNHIINECSKLADKKYNTKYEHCMVKIGPNTEKSPGDRRRLAVTTVKDH